MNYNRAAIQPCFAHVIVLTADDTHTHVTRETHVIPDTRRSGGEEKEAG